MTTRPTHPHPEEHEAPAKFPGAREDKRPVTDEQADGMDDMLRFGESKHE